MVLDLSSAPKVYLAGPGVFRTDAAELAARLKAICASQGLAGLWPLDQDVDATRPGPHQADDIRRGNEAMIRRACAVVADLSPFRGANMDPGTAYEIGFAVALGHPVFAYSSDRRTLLARTAPGATAPAHDADGLLIEDFGLPENLMIATAVHDIADSAEAAIAACARHLRAAVSR
jgi:nucleoside 2-deoxyribosyltransferase